MKYLLTLFLFTNFLFANVQEYLPALTGRVVDNAQILNRETIVSLNNILKKEEDNSTNQIVVATVKSLHGYSIDGFGLNLARKWALGQKDKNNGVLLLVAPNEKKVRIEVGYGLEGALTDKISHEIITYTITPAFKKGDFNGGILNGTKEIIQVVNGEYELKSTPKIESEFPIFIIFFLSFAVLTLGSIIKNATARKIGFSAFISAFSFPVSYGLFSPSIIIPIIIMTAFGAGIFFMVKNKNFAQSSSGKNAGFIGGFGSNSFGSGGFSGGFSGGGGSFGGGGASGGW